MGNWIKSVNGYNKAKKIEEYCFATDRKVEIKDSIQGIRVNNKILIAYGKSRWKILGQLQWYPYYGITKLMDALFDDRLEEYALEQQTENTRKEYATPVAKISDKKVKEIMQKKILSYIYEE